MARVRGLMAPAFCITATHSHSLCFLFSSKGIEFQGSELHIGPSKFSEVSMPRAGQDMDDDAQNNTKDYANSPIHRFKVSAHFAWLDFRGGPSASVE